MQLRAFGGRDHESRGTRPARFGNLHRPRHAERRRGVLDEVEHGFFSALFEIAAGARNAQALQAETEFAAHQFGRARSAHGVLRIRPLHGVIARRQVGRRPAKRPEVVERGDKRKAAGPRQPPVGRLQPEDPAQGRRHADRSVGIRAQRDRHQAAGDRSRRPARRTSGNVRRVVRVARRTVVGVLGGEAVGVLVHVERSHEDCAGCIEA